MAINLNYIDIVVLLAGLFALIKLTVSYMQGFFSIRRYILGLGFWFVLISLVLYPGISDIIARSLGVDRGTDVAFFTSILIIFYILFKIFIRLEIMEKNITKLVSEIALRGGDKNSKS